MERAALVYDPESGSGSSSDPNHSEFVWPKAVRSNAQENVLPFTRSNGG